RIMTPARQLVCRQLLRLGHTAGNCARDQRCWRVCELNQPVRRGLVTRAGWNVQSRHVVIVTATTLPVNSPSQGKVPKRGAANYGATNRGVYGLAFMFRFIRWRPRYKIEANK